MAAETEQSEILKLLLDGRHADPFQPNSRGRSALHESAANDFKASVKLILDHPTCNEERVNMSDSNGNTALHEAVKKNSVEVVQLLIEAGANPDKDNFNGQTSKDIALAKKYVKIQEIIAKAPELLQKRLDQRRADESSKVQAEPPKCDSIPTPPPPSKVAGGGGAKPAVKAPEIPADITVLSWNDIDIAKENAIIGEGSFGIVYRGKYYPNSRRDLDGIDVAVKVMSSIMVPTLKEFDTIRSKTLQEASTAKKIASLVACPEAIVNLIGVVEGSVPPAISALRHFEVKNGEETVLGIVMQFEGGGSLENLLYKSGRQLNLEDKFRILVGIAFSIAELHGARPNYFVHGDIKPDNILLSHEWPPVVKLTDFGLTDSRKAVAGVQMSMLRTTLVQQGNTPIYSAPEILPSLETGEPTYSHSRTSDMYAFGLVAWEILSGEKPYADVSNFYQFVFKVQSGHRPDMDKLTADVPGPVKNMISSLLNPDRAQRMTSSECYSVLHLAYTRLCSSRYDVFLSHPFVNKRIIRHIFRLLTDCGYRVLFDESDKGFTSQEAQENGIRNSAVVVVCVDETYQKSADCMKELKDAVEGHRKPIITLYTQSHQEKWASPELSRLRSIPVKKYVVDVSVATETVDNDGHAADWEDPSDSMLTKLQEELQPLFRVLKDMHVPVSLVEEKCSLLRRPSANSNYDDVSDLGSSRDPSFGNNR